MALDEIIKGDVSPMCRQKSKIDNIIKDRQFVYKTLFSKLKTRMKNLQLKFLICIIFETAAQNVILIRKIVLTEMVATRLY
jgi:hypothetical protein